MTRTTSTLLMLEIQIGTPIFLMIMNALSNRWPESMLNIPDREFWLAPERREATIVTNTSPNRNF